MEGGRSRFENIIRQLPEVPGFKFHPTDEEVFNFYLLNKNAGNLVAIDPIRTDQDIISRHPVAVQAHFPLLPPENAWLFYTFRDAKYPNNGKLKIENAGGFWMVSKASVPIGPDIGHKRVLNFKEGSLKSYTPTNWYMEEYSIKKFAPNKEDEDWVIVRIYQQLTKPIRGGWFGSAYYLPLDSGEGDISGSAYPFQPPGSGGTGMEGGRSTFENIIRQLPEVPGFKFHPTDEEVINFYLPNKNAGNLVAIDPIRTDQDIISRHPVTVQAHYPLLSPENAWLFYTFRDAKYPNNGKLKIENAGGFWMVSKASVPIGPDIGHKRVLNFKEGSLKSYTPTNWYMEEYSIKKFDPKKEDEDWVIVRIYQQLTMPLSTMPIRTTFPLTMSMPTPYVSTIRPRGMLQPTCFELFELPCSPLISAGSLSPNPEIQTWPDSNANSGGLSWSAYYLPSDSGEGGISNLSQLPGSGGTGTSTSAFPSPWGAVD
ncbi:hypothetical protein RHMOL_Rhmol04G0126900 [Rhododendron molle]|nr:hypothetical protein RHMOL_Rhmol04G0126900 [Rhododendron molle]